MVTSRLNNRWALAILAGLFLIICASRLMRLSTLDMDPDEVWSVWQTLGTPQQVIEWTPNDWSPVYYLLVDGWQHLTGLNPFTLRLLPLFGFLVGLAILYRSAVTIYDARTGLIAVAACAAMGFGIHIGLLLRAYSLIFTLTLLAWWLAIRYFRRPTVLRGILLGLCAALMFYMHVTSIFALVIIGLYTAILFPRRIWRWWLPAAIFTPLAIPEITSKFWLASGKATTGLPVLQQWLAGGGTVLFQQLASLLRDFAGYSFRLWIALMIMAGVILIERFHFERRFWALGIWVLAPLLLFVMSLFDAYSNRHLAWVMPGFALWIGWGFARLPRSAIAGLMVVFILTMFGPVPIAARYKRVFAPLVSSFSFLKQHAQSGDVVVVDPNVKDIGAEEWDFYSRAYFPQGLDFVTGPGQHRRVWYVTSDQRQDTATRRAVEQNRAESLITGDGSFAMELYQAPPDIQGVLFANGMRFHGIEAVGPSGPLAVWHEGETIRVRLWWSADHQVDLDYSVGTYLNSSNGLLAQTDSAPQVIDGPHETSRWVTGRYYVEERELTLPEGMTTGQYALTLSVYGYWDSKRLTAPGVNSDLLLPAMTVNVKAW